MLHALELSGQNLQRAHPSTPTQLLVQQQQMACPLNRPRPRRRYVVLKYSSRLAFHCHLLPPVALHNLVQHNSATQSSRASSLPSGTGQAQPCSNTRCRRTWIARETGTSCEGCLYNNLPCTQGEAGQGNATELCGGDHARSRCVGSFGRDPSVLPRASRARLTL